MYIYIKLVIMDVKDMVQQLKKINISEKEFISWGKDDLKRLSQGFMTNELKTINVDNKSFKVKLSFKDGNLMIHPKKKQMNNTLGFSQEHLNALKNGQPVFKNRSVYQLDRDINEILSIKSNRLMHKLPNEYNGIKLSQDQKRNISLGKEIDKQGTTRSIINHLDLNNPMLFNNLILAKKIANHKQELLNKSTIKQSLVSQKEKVDGRSNQEIKKEIKPAINNTLKNDISAKEAKNILKKAQGRKR